MAYFDTEELWFPEWEHGGTPWDNPEAYARDNPVEFVKNWKTPMLVVHGEQDFRVVYTQGLSSFTALRRQGDSGPADDPAGREPLGAQAAQLDPVARGSARVDEALDAVAATRRGRRP